MRALVVEDEAALREGLRDQLVEKGFTVDVAADGNEGLFAGSEYPLDIAVIDLGLPKVSGLDLIRALRKAGKRVTAYEHCRWDIQAAGGDYVTTDQAVRDGRIVTGQTWQSHPEFYRLVFQCLA